MGQSTALGPALQDYDALAKKLKEVSALGGISGLLVRRCRRCFAAGVECGLVHAAAV